MNTTWSLEYNGRETRLEQSNEGVYDSGIFRRAKQCLMHIFPTLCMSCEASVAMMMVMTYMKHKVFQFDNSIRKGCLYVIGTTILSRPQCLRKEQQVNCPKIRLT